MKYNRVHNFAPGPAQLPLSVVESLVQELPNLQGTGIGLMEISHRSPTFDAIVRSAQNRLKALLSVPEGYQVLFLQGGASLQFLMAPMNLLNPGDKADYINTGTWSTKALNEARTVGDIAVAWTGEADNFDHVPAGGDYSVREDAVYLHYTTNNTIFGTEFTAAPESGGIPLVADASSDIASRPLEVARHAIIYAGAQKNLGPSGVTVVIIREDILERCTRPIPSMLDYRVHIAKNTLFNTPNTVGIFVVDRYLAWLQEQGGVDAIFAMNREKAGKLYAELDRGDFWLPHAEKNSRSLMNVTWRIRQPDLEPVFLAEATEAGFSGLKGHRSVGGIRASLYNACSMEAVEALVEFMRDFQRQWG